jgi:hypothetical protein
MLEQMHTRQDLRFGAIVLNYNHLYFSIFAHDETDHYLAAGFLQGDALSAAGPAGEPPAGTCLAWSSPPAALFHPDALAKTARGLDAGLVLYVFSDTDSGGINPLSTGAYFADWKIEEGPYQVQNTLLPRQLGGKDVPQFVAGAFSPPRVMWNETDFETTANGGSCSSNDFVLCSVDRSKGLTVTWPVMEPGAKISIRGQSSVVLGISLPVQATATSYFVCTERAEAGTFTVPPYVLKTLPAGPPDGLAGPATLSVGRSIWQPFSAMGLDIGYFLSRSFRSVWLRYE